MKTMLKGLVKRFMNYGTLVAIAAFVVNKLIGEGIIPTAELGDTILSIVHYVLYLLVLVGVLNNAGIGRGFSDIKK